MLFVFLRLKKIRGFGNKNETSYFFIYFYDKNYIVYLLSFIISIKRSNRYMLSCGPGADSG